MTALSLLELVRVTKMPTPERRSTMHVILPHTRNNGIASAATSLVIAHIAGGTKTIRVGAGGPP